MFIFLVTEWQPEQNKIIKKMKKGQMKEKFPGFLPNTILTLALNLNFFLDIQPKSMKLTYYTPYSQLINTYFFGAHEIS